MAYNLRPRPKKVSNAPRGSQASKGSKVLRVSKASKVSKAPKRTSEQADTLKSSRQAHSRGMNTSRRRLHLSREPTEVLDRGIAAVRPALQLFEDARKKNERAPVEHALPSIENVDPSVKVESPVHIKVEDASVDIYRIPSFQESNESSNYESPLGYRVIPGYAFICLGGRDPGILNT